MKAIILSLIFSIVSFSLIAQMNQFELNISHGKTSDNFYDSKFINPFESELPDFYRIGLLYYYTPKNALLKIKTGLTYDIRGESNNNLKYLRTPIGIDLQYGNKIYFIAGGGVILSYLINYQGIKSSDFLDSKNDFQLLAETNAGIGVNVLNHYSITFGYQINFDLTKMYEDKGMSPGGASYIDDIKGRDGFFYIGIRYKLTKK